MAEVLDDYDFSRFPYKLWFDGRIWRIKRGDNFPMKSTTMAAYLRTEARERHQTLDLRVENDDAIVFQAHRAEPPRAVERIGASR